MAVMTSTRRLHTVNIKTYPKLSTKSSQVNTIQASAVEKRRKNEKIALGGNGYVMKTRRIYIF